MQLARRFRLPALFCAFAVLACALVSRPYANMGISDDGTYIRSAQRLLATGHILYNGVETPMLGWQLYLGAVFIRIFGFSLTTVRMSTLLVALLTAWLLQRTLALAGINERNATLGTLAFVLSPLYLMLSVTYMSDIFGLLAVVACLYACLHALQARTEGSAIFWLCFAIAANAICGAARQIAWLGILVMVPSALYLLRERRRVLLAGAAATLAGAGFVFACMQWFGRQPYSVPERLVLHKGGGLNILSAFFHASLDLPFLLFPMIVLFLPALRRDARRSVMVASAAFGVWLPILFLLHAMHAQDRPVLVPTMKDWVTRYDGYQDSYLTGHAPVFLGQFTRVALTAASLGGLFGLVVSLVRGRRGSPEADAELPISWRDLCILVAPFLVAYALILVPRASSAYGIYDRYLLEPLAVALPWLVRLYQERIQARMPRAALLLVAATAVYGIAMTHNMFSLYRARVKLAAELRSHGVPDTSVDNGWEYNFMVELRHSDHINDPRIVVPSGAYVPSPPLPADSCPIFWSDYTPHVRPIYGVSFDPNACYGPAPFAPVHYSRWLAKSPGTLYVVRYLPPAEQ